MKLNKALKTLERKGTGFVFKMSEMEQNYNIERFVNDIQTHGFTLGYLDADSYNFIVEPFKFVWSGEQNGFVDFYILEPELEYEDLDDNNDGWGYYSFETFFSKFSVTSEVLINFGIHSIVHKQTEAYLSLYKT